MDPSRNGQIPSPSQVVATALDLLAAAGQEFSLPVQGNSMLPLIRAGDVLLVRKSGAPLEQGEILVATVTAPSGARLPRSFQPHRSRAGPKSLWLSRRGRHWLAFISALGESSPHAGHSATVLRDGKLDRAMTARAVEKGAFRSRPTPSFTVRPKQSSARLCTSIPLPRTSR